jgi:signal transduction histidine kinase
VLARLASLRLWLLVAMIASAVVGLVVAALLFPQVQASHEHVADAAKARSEARTIAAQVQAGAGRRELTALQRVLVNDRITVVRDGRTIFDGPVRRGRELELQEQARFPGGVVRITDYSSPTSSDTLELTLIMAGVLALVVAAAVVTTTIIMRAVRLPVQRAIDAAERVSHGELSARMGSSGPEELGKLGHAFDEMAAKLERADRDQRQFLADVAHEIATPLNAVSGFAVALADGAAENPDERVEIKSLVEAETQRLRNLIDDLRELTRLDLTERVRPAPVGLAQFTSRVVASFRAAAESAGIELTSSVRGDAVYTDERLLEMVASNLLSNAVRYTPRGGHVHFGMRQHRDKLVMSVRDDGVGISPEHQARVFERLYRVDSTRDRATGGSGLGLSIAARAARSLGGHLELDSVPGKGSEFRLVVPARLADPKPAAAAV